jgi:FkbM family methyltransferase
VYSFNDPAEIPRLRASYDVEFVPLSTSSADEFGKHYAPVSELLRWVVQRDAPVLLVNSDIGLDLAAWELDRIRRIADDGLCWFVRHNREEDGAEAKVERHGIDAFLFHGRNLPALPESFLSIGQPVWDYWLPYAFVASGLPLYSVDFPAMHHVRHPTNWSWETWHRCALEFSRVTGEVPEDASFESYIEMFRALRASFGEQSTRIEREPQPIRNWIGATFGDTASKTFLELGAHRGEDTAWLSEVPGVTLHAFEPDPRNHQAARPNVTLHRAAVGAYDGRAMLFQSSELQGEPWTFSSSIRRPLNHLTRHPVSFEGEVDVELVSLDTFVREQSIAYVDLVWADVQGAEGDVIRGGLQALERTRFLYTEYSDDELYEGQVTLSEMLALLPAFRVVELWPEDVLLENTSFAP